MKNGRMAVADERVIEAEEIKLITPEKREAGASNDVSRNRRCYFKAVIKITTPMTDAELEYRRYYRAGRGTCTAGMASS